GAAPTDAKFVIRAEKTPNRRGVEMILRAAGGNVLEREALWDRAAKGEIAALWIAGGYPRADWPDKELVVAVGKAAFSVVQDTLPNELTAAATVVVPASAWVEREGTFVNAGGLLQPFERAINPPEGARTDGQFLFQLAGHSGL